MEDDLELKRHRIRMFKGLLRERAGGNAASFAKMLDRSPQQVNDILRERKAFGERFARYVEAQLGLEAGYLDGTVRESADHAVLIGKERRLLDARRWLIGEQQDQFLMQIEALSSANRRAAQTFGPRVVDEPAADAPTRRKVKVKVRA